MKPLGPKWLYGMSGWRWLLGIVRGQNVEEGRKIVEEYGRKKAPLGVSYQNQRRVFSERNQWQRGGPGCKWLLGLIGAEAGNDYYNLVFFPRLLDARKRDYRLVVLIGWVGVGQENCTITGTM